MAVTTINLSDPVSTLVTKTNTISTNLGDIVTLETTATNLVAAINEVRDQIIDIDDSSEIVSIARNSLSVINNATVYSLAYDSSAGSITISGNLASDSAGGILFDSAAGQFSLAPNTITSSLFSSSVSLIIYDSAGSPVKTLYSPGS